MANPSHFGAHRGSRYSWHCLNSNCIHGRARTPQASTVEVCQCGYNQITGLQGAPPQQNQQHSITHVPGYPANYMPSYGYQQPVQPYGMSNVQGFPGNHLSSPYGYPQTNQFSGMGNVQGFPGNHLSQYTFPQPPSSMPPPPISAPTQPDLENQESESDRKRKRGEDQGNENRVEEKKPRYNHFDEPVNMSTPAGGAFSRGRGRGRGTGRGLGRGTGRGRSHGLQAGNPPTNTAASQDPPVFSVQPPEQALGIPEDQTSETKNTADYDTTVYCRQCHLWGHPSSAHSTGLSKIQKPFKARRFALQLSTDFDAAKEIRSVLCVYKLCAVLEEHLGDLLAFVTYRDTEQDDVLEKARDNAQRIPVAERERLLTRLDYLLQQSNIAAANLIRSLYYTIKKLCCLFLDHNPLDKKHKLPEGITTLVADLSYFRADLPLLCEPSQMKEHQRYQFSSAINHMKIEADQKIHEVRHEEVEKCLRQSFYSAITKFHKKMAALVDDCEQNGDPATILLSGTNYGRIPFLVFQMEIGVPTAGVLIPTIVVPSYKSIRYYAIEHELPHTIEAANARRATLQRINAESSGTTAAVPLRPLLREPAFEQSVESLIAKDNKRSLGTIELTKSDQIIPATQANERTGPTEETQPAGHKSSIPSERNLASTAPLSSMNLVKSTQSVADIQSIVNTEEPDVVQHDGEEPNTSIEKTNVTQHIGEQLDTSIAESTALPDSDIELDTDLEETVGEQHDGENPSASIEGLDASKEDMDFVSNICRQAEEETTEAERLDTADNAE